MTRRARKVRRESAMSMTATPYAWAVPAFIDESPVDHTWVTSYDNRKQIYPDIAAVIAGKHDYWYCWGDYHAKGGTPGNASGFLGSQGGDLGLSRCLAQSNADCSSTFAARGTISPTASTASAINSPTRSFTRRGSAAPGR